MVIQVVFVIQDGVVQSAKLEINVRQIHVQMVNVFNKETLTFVNVHQAILDKGAKTVTLVIQIHALTDNV